MEGALNNILHGNCLDVLQTIPDDRIDLICTDPPYGYSFMGKDWDRVIMGVEYWAECLRVLKPGALAFVMSAPRQDVLSRAIVNLQDAGFETGFTSIYWTYASGFPKAMNIGKMLDKRLGATREIVAGGVGTDRGYSGGFKPRKAISPEAVSTAAVSLNGSYGGFQPKPAVEVVIVAMKPCSEKTYIDQALKNGKGITWLDDARIPTHENLNGGAYSGNERDNGEWRDGSGFKNDNLEEFVQPPGRFPANLLVSDDVLNDGRITKGNRIETSSVCDEEANTWGGTFQRYRGPRGHDDAGSYSRFFSLDAWAEKLPEHVRKVFPFLIVPKASKREKNDGLEALPVRQTKGGGGVNSPVASAYGSVKASGHNFHPTVKPLALMSYLITLGSRPGDVVLDPFAGSGTTCVAALVLGRKYIGIEREREYVAIAEGRLEALRQVPNRGLVAHGRETQNRGGAGDRERFGRPVRRSRRRT